MIKKKQSDGPRNSQGYGWSWRYLQTILRMSYESELARADVARWWMFLAANPELKEDIRRELCHVPAEKLIERMEDMIERHASEQRRRKQVLENANG